MGLDIWDVLAEGSKKGKIDDVSAMSCCHWGFLRAFLSLRDCVDETLHELTDGFSEGYSIFFVGHSLGGALATLSAADTAQRHGRGTGNDDLNVSLINFGSPRVGNRAFARQFNALVPNAFRIVNGADLVCILLVSCPSSSICKCFSLTMVLFYTSFGLRRLRECHRRPLGCAEDSDMLGGRYWLRRMARFGLKENMEAMFQIRSQNLVWRN